MGKIKMLIVDDEREFVDFLKERLELRGIHPIVAYSGEEAVELAKKKHIDAAIVDLKMPGMDGLVCITKLKEHNPKVKTVLLTGFGDEKVQQATEALDSEYYDKGEMEKFWDFIKRLPKTLESSMAAAGMSSYGNIEDAAKMVEEEEEDENNETKPPK